MIEVQAREQRRLLVGLCLVIGSTFIVLSMFNFMLTPMLADLGLSRDDASLALRVTSLASLLVVFVAGLLGDRLGHRRVITWLSLAFIAGSVMVMTAQGLPLVALGMLIEGIGATGIQIVTVGLLAARFTGEQRAPAFATYGMVYPAVYVVFPALSGLIVTHASWRIVPALWVAAGIVVLIVARTMLPPDAHRARVGEIGTPIAAGLLVVLIVQAISHVTAYGLTSWPVVISSCAAALLAVGIAWRLRRNPPAALSIDPLRRGATSLLLVVVILVPLMNTWVYLNLGFQYLHGMSAFQTALALLPAQVGAIVGAKLLAGAVMRRIGPVRGGTILLLALTGVMMLSLIAGTDSPTWHLIVYAALFGTASTAVTVVLITAVMSTSTPGAEGTTSAYRGAAGAVGSALGVVIMGWVVFTAGQATLAGGLEGAGLTREQAAAVMEEIAQTSAAPEVLADYSVPLPDGTSVTALEREAMVAGLHANGVASAVIALAGAGLLAYHRRRHPADA